MESSPLILQNQAEARLPCVALVLNLNWYELSEGFQLRNAGLAPKLQHVPGGGRAYWSRTRALTATEHLCEFLGDLRLAQHVPKAMRSIVLLFCISMYHDLIINLQY